MLPNRSHPLPSGGQRREKDFHRLATGGYVLGVLGTRFFDICQPWPRRSASKIGEAASIVAERRVSSGDDRSVPLAIWYATPNTTMSKWQSEMSYNR